MCGIFGYTGKRHSVNIVLDGLKSLEYRGYDSAGIVGLKDGQVHYCKEVGKVAVLEKLLSESALTLDIAIGQTRWATHGMPSRINAHPHFDNDKSLALVHNGIIENYVSLRDQLSKKGAIFVSETDTEVIAHLISSHYNGDLLDAIKKAMHELKGAFAIALVHKDHPEKIYAVANESPLAIGLGEEETFLASDSRAFANYVKNALFLTNQEIAIISPDGCEVYDLTKGKIEKIFEQIALDSLDVSKGRYAHYTLKEINEQPDAIRNAMNSRFAEELGTASFEEIDLKKINLMDAERIVILACGTSWHAAYVASYLIEEAAGIPVDVEVSSEFRYKTAVVSPGTVAIAISQSGETADTIAAMRFLKHRGIKVLALCNVAGSTLAREADATILLRAGPEVGVCSTKAFTSQLIILSMLALMLARGKKMSLEKGGEFIQAAKSLPVQVQQILDRAQYIQQIAKKYARYNQFFYIGRNYMYPTCLESALKLKEISYINANGYAAGEVKHGSIALIDENCPTVAFCANDKTYSKLHSNIMEIKARKGLVIAICSENQDLNLVADDIIFIPHTIDPLAPILASVAGQLFAYYVALEIGAEIDQPRNLAKSVTVE